MKVTSRSTNQTRCSPRKARWWGRLVVTVFFGFYLNYVPIHLATVAHLNDLLTSIGALHDHEHAAGTHHNDADHHIPHPAADHTLNVTAQTHAPSTVVISVLYVLVDTSVLIHHPQQQQRIPVFERIRPPGVSAPDPLQPRAPPLA